MRKRFNRQAICSSENYRASKKAHKEMLEEKHTSFCNLAIASVGNYKPLYKTIKVFGKEMKLTIEEYNTHYAKCNF